MTHLAPPEGIDVYHHDIRATVTVPPRWLRWWPWWPKASFVVWMDESDRLHIEADDPVQR